MSLQEVLVPDIGNFDSVDVIEVLVKAGAILTYIPSDEESYSSPFVSAPAQTALAEASRCGFLRIVQVKISDEQ